MKYLMPLAKGRLTRLATACVLAAGTAGTVMLLAASGASATSCGSGIAAGSNCTLTGTLGLSAGSLTMTSPSAVGWTGTLNGLDLNLVDTTDNAYTVNDATGSGSGWKVTLSATQFQASAHTLANSGTLALNGSGGSMTATTAPTNGCTASATCTDPTNDTTYPVALTTATSGPTAWTIYDTEANTGEGSIAISNNDYWIDVPANTVPGNYTSTFTLEVVSGP